MQRFSACLVLLLAGHTASPAGESPDAARLVRQLGNPDYPARETASESLWALGEAATPALTAALASRDAEVARRARLVLDRFAAGDLPNTPPDVLNHLREFRGGDPAKQFAAYKALFALGPNGVRVLQNVLASPVPTAEPNAVVAAITADLAAEVPKLLVAGRRDEAEAALALNTLIPTPAGLNDTVAFLRLRGRLAAGVAAVEAAAAGTPYQADARRRSLVFLARAAGRPAEALKLAEAIEARDPSYRPVRDALLEATGDWATLANRPDANANSVPGLTAFRLREAGEFDAADELLRGEIESADRGTRYPGTIDAPTLALFANGRPAEAIGRLRATGNAPQILADVLAAQLKFAEALDLIPPDGRADQGFNAAVLQASYTARRGQLLARLGDRAGAERQFRRSYDTVVGISPPWDPAMTQLVRAELHAQRPDLACEHFGGWLRHPARPAALARTGQDPFELIFRRDAEAAAGLWHALRLGVGGRTDGGAVMQHVRRLLRGEGTAAEVEAAVTAVEAQNLPEPAGSLSVAELYRKHGRPADALAALSRPADGGKMLPPAQVAAGPRSWVFGTDETFHYWVELGDLLTEQGKHREAAERLLQGAKLYPRNPILLDLAGRARRRAGDEAGAATLIEAAHAVPLGDSRLRGRYLEELLDRGHLADALRERDLIRDCAWLNETYLGNVWNQVARASNAAGEYAVAAAASKKAIHYLLRTPDIGYVEGTGYLSVPSGIRFYEAQAKLAAGGPAALDAGVAGLRAALADTPGGSDQLFTAVAMLDKAGRKADADAVFRGAFDAYKAVLTAHPKSAWTRHAAAWLACGCRRELGAALTLAREAVAAEPAVESYRECLAEAHFRTGDRAAAQEIIGGLLKENRRNSHYHRQLERYGSAGFDSPVPDTDD